MCYGTIAVSEVWMLLIVDAVTLRACQQVGWGLAEWLMVGCARERGSEGRVISREVDGGDKMTPHSGVGVRGYVSCRCRFSWGVCIEGV